MPKIIALDPGVTTGIAIGWTDRIDFVGIKYFQAMWQESELYGFLEDEDPNYLIYESFQYRPGKAKPSINLTPTELIGVIKLYSQLIMPPNCTYPQSAATGKEFWTDEKLKEYELYDKRYRHGRDACRHMLQWLNFRAGFKLVENPTYQLRNEV